jgi:hypothetical protein
LLSVTEGMKSDLWAAHDDAPRQEFSPPTWPGLRVHQLSITKARFPIALSTPLTLPHNFFGAL